MSDKKWRSAPRTTLNARPITVKQIPKLVSAMQEDGLIGVITHTGISWEIGGYQLTKSSVKDAWKLSNSQMDRLCTYVYEHGW